VKRTIAPGFGDRQVKEKNTSRYYYHEFALREKGCPRLDLSPLRSTTIQPFELLSETEYLVLDRLHSLGTVCFLPGKQSTTSFLQEPGPLLSIPQTSRNSLLSSEP